MKREAINRGTRERFKRQALDSWRAYQGNTRHLTASKCKTGYRTGELMPKEPCLPDRLSWLPMIKPNEYAIQIDSLGYR